MSFLTWSDDLDTGIDIIDSQHKRIVDYINDLHAATQTNDRDAVGTVIDELVDYTISHFAFEESLMEKANYAFLDPHKRVHELFIKKINGFVERHENGEDVSGELLRLLQRWLINHIKNEDADYGEVVLRSMEQIHADPNSGGGGWLGRSLKKFFG